MDGLAVAVASLGALPQPAMNLLVAFAAVCQFPECTRDTSATTTWKPQATSSTKMLGRGLADSVVGLTSGESACCARCGLNRAYDGTSDDSGSPGAGRCFFAGLPRMGVLPAAASTAMAQHSCDAIASAQGKCHVVCIDMGEDTLKSCPCLECVLDAEITTSVFATNAAVITSGDVEALPASLTAFGLSVYSIDGTMAEVFGRLSALRHIDLEVCDPVPGDAASFLFESQHALRSVSLRLHGGAADGVDRSRDISELPPCGIEQLTINQSLGPVMVTPQLLSTIFPQLRVLCIPRGCSDAHLMAMAFGCPHLTRVTVGGPTISNEGVLRLVCLDASSRVLRDVELTNAVNVTSDVLRMCVQSPFGPPTTVVQLHLGHLDWVDGGGCDDVEALVHWPSLRRVSIEVSQLETLGAARQGWLADSTSQHPSLRCEVIVAGTRAVM